MVHYVANYPLYLILSISVTRLKDYFSNVWPLTTIKIGPIAIKIGRNRDALLANTKNNL